MESVFIDNVSKWRGAQRVLADVTVRVMPGEVVALLGPSGAGKSTLLRCVNHLEVVDQGRIFVEGSLIGYRQAGDKLYELKESEICAQRSRIGMVFQNFNLIRHLSALDNVMLGPLNVLDMSREQARRRAHDLLQMVGLGHKAASFPSQLSGGQQQRVAIARSLAMEPGLMLLDEPTSALDPELAEEVLATIRALVAQGRTMMIATHDMALARDLADRVIFMEAGAVVEDVPAPQFFERPRSERARQFLKRLAPQPQ
ncbi:amino acid ABC transporter ATP-binding protein, partial [Herbaspirillum sp. YR522]|uniref:amino acid ABC transporter ATP-binding protein n=1 Tax=Herbaspirillum sp. YR522 TaxID=1144342 RepID=UPI00026FB383